MANCKEYPRDYLLWKKKRTLLYYRFWIQFSSRIAMNGTLNLFIFNLHSHNFNLWPLSLTSGRTHRYFCRKTHRRLPWSRQMVLREYICIPHFRTISHAILHGVPREGKRRPHLQSAVFCIYNSSSWILKIDNSSSLRFIQWTKLELSSFYTNLSSKLCSDPNVKKAVLIPLCDWRKKSLKGAP